MPSKRDLEIRLAGLDGFADPKVELEQYATPADLAASLLHVADLQGDLGGRTVVDLGSGTGILALGAALRGAGRVVGVERDVAALAVARENGRRLDFPGTVDPTPTVHWVLGDATEPPLCLDGPLTVVMNPPFGAQRGNVHADRAFLAAASRVASVSYSIHNAESHGFVEAFAGDNGGRLTHAFSASLSVDRQFHFHDEETRELPVEAFRIEWGDGD